MLLSHAKQARGPSSNQADFKREPSWAKQAREPATVFEYLASGEG